MARYDVFANLDGAGYLLDVQSDLLDGLNTRVVVPLLAEASAPKAAGRLNPVFEIAGGRHVMVTQFLAAVPQSILAAPVANFDQHHDAITNALDMVFYGF